MAINDMFRFLVLILIFSYRLRHGSVPGLQPGPIPPTASGSACWSRHFHAVPGVTQRIRAASSLSFTRGFRRNGRCNKQHKVRVAIKFLRMNAVLHEYKFNICHVEAGFLLDFAAERASGGFAPLDLPPGNAPEIRDCGCESSALRPPP